jgi:ficolin
MPFSTRDQDHDHDHSSSCAIRYRGAWWYSGGYFYANLNGEYYKESSTTMYAHGIIWRDWTGYSYSLKWTEMKFRPL